MNLGLEPKWNLLYQKVGVTKWNLLYQKVGVTKGNLNEVARSQMELE